MQLSADIIVAQGSEAGGHGATRGTFALVPAVVDAVAPIPVIVAVGIADGRGLAAALMLGAQGVLMGTRFYACTESLGHDRAKKLITEAHGDDTIRSNVFDDARGFHWLPPYTARSLPNELSAKKFHPGPHVYAMTAEERAEYQAALAAGNFNIAGVMAGENVDLIHEVITAKEIVERTVEDAKRLDTHHQ